MKLVGIRDGLRTVVGRQFDDGTVAPLADATEFYAALQRWTAAAAALQSGERFRDGIDEAPAVPPRFLGPGDVAEVEIDRVGAVTDPVVA